MPAVRRRPGVTKLWDNLSARAGRMMDDKYNIQKPKKPETRQEELDLEIRELARRRDASSNAAERQELDAKITKLFAQYQRLKI